MAKLEIIGFLGKDCQVNQAGNKQVINFSVCHTDKWKDNTGQQKEKSVWVEAAYFTDKTSIAQYLLKGQLVYVEGIPELRTYQKNDGTTGTILSLRVQSIQLLGGKAQTGANDEEPLPF